MTNCRGTFEPYVVVILEHKKDPNRLVVDESVNDENSMICLNPQIMETLQLFRGDTVLKVPRSTILVSTLAFELEFFYQILHSLHFFNTMEMACAW